MDATFRALCTHGHADLSIASIAEEFDESRSLLYCHYDSKGDLIAEFLGHAIDCFPADPGAQTGDNPGRRYARTWGTIRVAAAEDVIAFVGGVPREG